MTRFRFDLVSQNANGPISHSKGPRLRQKVGGNTNVATPRKKASLVKRSAKTEVCDGMLSIELPLRTKSEANCFEHWRVKHQRHRSQQNALALALNPIRHHVRLPCKILFTRYAPRKLDKHDNLPMSFKYIVDACCSVITGNYEAGKADSDERISITYDQVVSKSYGIKVEITF